MIVNNVELKAVAVKPAQFPDDNKPEFALVGKSNVGKSSLINTMLNRKSLARTSQTPGKTRTINFYDIENRFYFVDLPGYGFSKISRKESEKWGEMVESYLKNRKELKAIIQLLDIRHEPSKNDLQMIDWYNYYGFDVIIVLTKSDKLTRNQLNKNISMIKKSINIEKDVSFIPFSSLKKAGIDELWEEILKYIPEEVY